MVRNNPKTTSVLSVVFVALVLYEVVQLMVVLSHPYIPQNSTSDSLLVIPGELEYVLYRDGHLGLHGGLLLHDQTEDTAVQGSQ